MYSPYFAEVTGGIRADEFILLQADKFQAKIISNDRFRNYQRQYPWLKVEDERLIKGGIAGGNLTVPGLKLVLSLRSNISELISELDQLHLARAERTNVPQTSIRPKLLLPDFQIEFHLDTSSKELLIGRNDPNEGIYPTIDLTPYGGEQAGVSRRHASLIHNNGTWSLKDLESVNCTRIDGQIIKPNELVSLKNGTVLHFGRLRVVFHLE